MTLPIAFDPQSLAWDKVGGLMPVIVQHHTEGHVLMLGYVNPAALQATLDTGRMTFFSRTKQRLWTKGETSGHFLDVQALQVDCDADTLLASVAPIGPTCHRGTDSCFDQDAAVAPRFEDPLSHLDAVLYDRRDADPAESYTARLRAAGTPRIAQKVGEEGVEVALAAVTRDPAGLAEEAADLLYHLLVLLQDRGLRLGDVYQVLAGRRK